MKNNSYHVFFTNLANPLKVDIVTSLRDEEKNVTELSKELKVEQSKASHALASLKACHIVEYKQQGKKRVYHLNKKIIVPMLKLIDKHSQAFCGKECKECGK